MAAITHETLFHYTNSSVASMVLKDRKIRLAPKWHLNDPREGSDFGDLLEEFLLLKGRGAGSSSGAVNALRDHQLYVSCFSTMGDVLSQWRAYAKNATGISIGLDYGLFRKSLSGQEHLVILPVEYADSLSDLPSGGETKQFFNIIESYDDSGGSPPAAFLQTLAKVKYAVKRKAYEEEKEIRLIYTPVSHKAPKAPKNANLKRGFFGSDDAIRDFYEIEFDGDTWSKLVTHVTLGPKNTSNPQVVRDFLDEHGLPNTQLQFSSAMYR